MNVFSFIPDQLVATKFFAPVTMGTLISRPRLMDLLSQDLTFPLILISAPAGFGKTTLLSTWAQKLPSNTFKPVWVSLDKDDNNPHLFWMSILTALTMTEREPFLPLLAQLQSSPDASPRHLVQTLINVLVAQETRFLLILDDYHFITDQEIHASLTYLIEHMPTQLRLIIATRTDPPFPFSRLRMKGLIQEVHTEQLRCTVQEIKTFFQQTKNISLSDVALREVALHTEGWLVGLQLLARSFRKRTNPLILLQAIQGDQQQILEYLTEEVLQQQPPKIQRFLLATSILTQLNVSLCDALIEETDSQQIFQHLKQSNLFIVALDTKQQWYRYHPLFTEALFHQLQQTQPEMVPLLHSRASYWYAQHDQITEAIFHALQAKDWSWAADLIERQNLALNTLTWGIRKQKVLLLRDWLEQLPSELLHSRPRLCLAYTWMFFFITPQPVLATRLRLTEQFLTKLLTQHRQELSSVPSTPETPRDLENLLAETITFQALIRSYDEEGETALDLCQQAQTKLQANNSSPLHSHLAASKIFATYSSSINNAEKAIQIGLQAALSRQTEGNIAQAISLIGETALHMIGTGQLQQIQRLTQQAIFLGTQPETSIQPVVGWPMLWQAEVLREQNQLEAAHVLTEEAIRRCEQVESPLSLIFSTMGYAMLLHVSLSRGALDEAYTALQEFEHLGRSMNQAFYLYLRSHFTTIDQIKLWLAYGELDRATQWLEQMDRRAPYGTLFAREREEVACGRVLLAQKHPTLALQRLFPVYQRAVQGGRWGHVLEIQLLQALAYQMCLEKTQAIDTLWNAVCLAKPEGYIRSFVNEGAPMKLLLTQLSKRKHKQESMAYVEKLLSAFEPERTIAPDRERLASPPLELLSKQEKKVLQLVSQGASNREIAQELVIVVDTVKRHISHIFFKLGVNNRVQAILQAKALKLLEEQEFL